MKALKSLTIMALALFTINVNANLRFTGSCSNDNIRHDIEPAYKNIGGKTIAEIRAQSTKELPRKNLNFGSDVAHFIFNFGSNQIRVTSELAQSPGTQLSAVLNPGNAIRVNDDSSNRTITIGSKKGSCIGAVTVKDANVSKAAGQLRRDGVTVTTLR